MKYLNSTIAIISLSASLFLFNACSNNSNKGNASVSENFSGSSTSQHEQQQEQLKEEESIDGVYTGFQTVSGLKLVAKLTISGDQWSAVSQLEYDSPEYQNGIVKEKDLYDNSGMVKIGYVSGSSARINGYPSMRKE
jgi:hypothetical protein